MLIQVEYTQILSSLTITNSTKAKTLLSHVTINKQITPKGSRELQVVPVVLSVLGSIPKILHRRLERFGIKVNVPTLQKSALLDVANILRLVLFV